MTGEFQALRLRRVLAELRQLDRIIEGHSHHIPFIRSSSINFDAREALRLTNELEMESRDLERYLARLIGAGQSLSRAIGNRPPQELTMGQFAPSQGGDLAELRAFAGRLPNRLASLKAQLVQLRTESLLRLNDPGRWGDASSQNPVNQIVGFVISVLDLIRKIKNLPG